MEEMISTPPVPAPAVTVQAICPQCHQPVQPTYYFCPNCGKKLSEAPLSTSLFSQVMLYGFSILLPVICYLAIGYWQGIKYMNSADPKAKQIGVIALALLLISSIIMFWLGIVWIQSTISAAISATPNLGGF